jgi:4-hydroxy-tetrahydrodipicolinate synthase
MKNLQGSIVALVTPFDKNEGIDFKALDRLIRFQLENGTDAILVNGTTGESPTITLEEFDRLTKHVVAKVGGAVPVIAGTGSNDTKQAVIKSQIAEKNGVDGLLVVSPYYNKPTRNGVLHYFASVAKASPLPIIIYNVPGRTGSNLTTELILEVAYQNRNVIGVKEASGSMEKIMDLIHMSSGDFRVYSGDDSLALSTVMMGGDGCISVVANQIPKVFSQMLHAGINGDVEIARNLHYKYLDLMKMNFIEANPIPVKTCLHAMGYIDLNFRSPMCRMEVENEETLLTKVRELGIVQEEIKEVILE